jgi:hypothetical protein
MRFSAPAVSRRRAWPDRPQAAALLAAVSDIGHGIDAVVVGEYERAFAGDQILHLVPLLNDCGVGLWLPELHGPVDLDNPTHAALITLLGAQSQREEGGTAAVVGGRCGRWRRSWRTRVTRAGRCGTGSGLTANVCRRRMVCRCSGR